MGTSRRAMLIVVPVVVVIAALAMMMRPLWTKPPLSTAPPVADFPDIAKLKSGDFLWPKNKGAVIPYSIATEVGVEEKEWELERQRFLANAEATGAGRQVADELRGMTYRQFEGVYFGDAPQGDQPALRAAPSVSVGHVAIVDVDAAGEVFVIEATPSPQSQSLRGAVTRVPYKIWLEGRKGYQVWHGRIKNSMDNRRSRIADIARTQVGKPYAFFNFDLNDDSGFYCSKLAWLSAWRGLDIALDGNSNADRSRQFPPWYSPRQLANSPEIEMLHKPGEY